MSFLYSCELVSHVHIHLPVVLRIWCAVYMHLFHCMFNMLPDQLSWRRVIKWTLAMCLLLSFS